ncbi:MAG: hypothetical protein IJ514_07830 [Clostridia bacterium]|nr:hypothetical protein [Clostridia bacterium]
MKNKFKYVLLLFLIALACVITGCKKEQEPPVYEVYGFTVEEETSVEYGQSYSIVRPCVTDSYGNTIDVTFDVKDSYGQEVETTMQTFFAVDGGGYTVTFYVTDYQNQAHSKQTKIKVLNAKDLVVTSKKVFDNDETVTITPLAKMEAPTYEYKVSFGGADVAVRANETGASFTPSGNGLYEVTVKATEGERTLKYTYELLVREPAQFGEVEVFDEYWAKARELNGYGAYGWEVTDTTESGVQDRFGEETKLLQITVNDGDAITYPRFYLNARRELSYYQTLAEDGYDMLSVWIYTDAADREVRRYRNASSSGNIKAGTLQSGVWTEIRIPVLNTGTDARYGNLQDHYENWKTQLVWLFNVNNADKTYPLTVYVDDIYVTKSVELEGTGATEDYSTGDTVRPEAFFEYDDTSYEAGYFISDEYGLRRYLTGDTEFQFTHNGAYTLSAIPKGNNYRADASVSFDVSDTITVGTNAIVERTSSSQTVTVTELFGQMQYETTVLTQKLHSAYYLGNEAVQTTDTGFVSTKDGYYQCLLTADYQAFGTTCTTYKEVTVDIYSEATKYEFIDVSSTDSLTTRIVHTKMIATAAEKEELGLVGDFYRTQGTQPNDAVGYARLGLKLLHSQAYYEEMLTGEWTISYDLYMKPEGVTDDGVTYDIRFGSEKTATTYTSNTLISVKYSFNDLFLGDDYVGNRLLIIMKSTSGSTKQYAYIGNFRFEKVEKVETENSQSDFFDNNKLGGLE